MFAGWVCRCWRRGDVQLRLAVCPYIYNIYIYVYIFDEVDHRERNPKKRRRRRRRREKGCSAAKFSNCFSHLRASADRVNISPYINIS